MFRYRRYLRRFQPLKYEKTVVCLSHELIVAVSKNRCFKLVDMTFKIVVR